jgi:hypothetical protein
VFNTSGFLVFLPMVQVLCGWPKGRSLVPCAS